MTKTEEIEKFAGLLYTPEQVAVICQLDRDAFLAALEDPQSEEYQAYYRGLYLSEAEIRESILTHAKAGSSPAQQMALRFLDEVKISQL
jgi:hypothetical protein